MSMNHTMQAAYETIRGNFVTTDDTPLDGVTSGLTYLFADMNIDEAWEVGPEANAVSIIFAGSDADNETFSWKIWAYRVGGPAELVCSGTGALSSSAIMQSGSSYYYADTLVITNLGNWFSIPDVIDSGNDRIAKLAFDACGYKYIYVEFTNVGGAGEVASVQAYGSYF